MEPILELAETLGKAIAASPQAVQLRKARQAVEERHELVALLNELQEQSERIDRLTEEKKPIEVADKRRLKELQEKLLADEDFKRLSAAQVEYVDLMRRVDGALRKQLADTEND